MDDVDDKVVITPGWRVDAWIAGASAFAGVLVAANVNWTLRPLVVLACMIAGPGWAIGGLVDLDDRVLGRVICGAMGVSVNILVALAMVELDAWHPQVAAAIMLEVSAAVLLVRSWRVRRRPFAAPTAATAVSAYTHLSPDEGIQAYPEPYPRPQPHETKVRMYIPGRERVHVAATRGEWVQVTVNGDVVGWVNGRRLHPPVLTSIAWYDRSVAAGRPGANRVVKVDVLIGALAGVAVLIGAFVDWTQGVFAANSFKFPVAFLFDAHTTSRDPTLGYLVAAIGLLGVFVSFVSGSSGWRVVLGLLALIVAALYCAQLTGALSDSGRTTSFTDLVGAGPWVTGVAGVVLAVSPLLKSRSKNVRR